MCDKHTHTQKEYFWRLLFWKAKEPNDKKPVSFFELVEEEEVKTIPMPRV